jgi:hypothetical protein
LTSKSSPSNTKKTKKERYITTIWPELVVQAEADVMGETHEKNKMNILSQYRLINADHEVYNKLREVQRLLQMALVSYRLWAQRVAIEINGDFLQIAYWAKANRPFWIIFVIAIIQVIEKNHITHNSVTHFMTMLPLGSGETIVGYLWRLRKAFYRTPVI